MYHYWYDYQCDIMIIIIISSMRLFAEGTRTSLQPLISNQMNRTMRWFQMITTTPSGEISIDDISDVILFPCIYLSSFHTNEIRIEYLYSLFVIWMLWCCFFISLLQISRYNRRHYQTIIMEVLQSCNCYQNIKSVIILFLH